MYAGISLRDWPTRAANFRKKSRKINYGRGEVAMPREHVVDFIV